MDPDTAGVEGVWFKEELGHIEKKDVMYSNTGCEIRKDLVPPENFEETVEEAVDCMIEKISSESPEFRLCYGRLVSTLQQLPDEQLDNIASHYLAPALVLENSLEAKTMVDALEAVAMNRQRGQELLVKYVFRASDFNKELIIRAIHVCFTVKEPSRDLISVIYDLAFNGSSMPEGLRDDDVKQRATLAYGALARSLAKVDPAAAEAIVHEIETAANDVPSTIERTVRSVHSSLVENHWHELHYHKMVLLHSLGNAGIERSKSLLVSHLDENVPSIWKRAAATALGQYSCDESANVLLRTLSVEEEESVWDEALIAYQRHPRRNNVSLANCLEERLRSDHKFKRRSVADFLKKLNFKLELPEIDWGTRVGSNNLGASFGIRMKNKMELNTEQLSTHFEIVVRDSGWVTVHLGLLKLNVDILRAEACYHGYVTYDLDTLKDFDIDGIQALSKTFEDIKDSVVGSVQQAIDAFKKIVCKGCLKEIFNNFVNNIVDLPRFVVNLRQVVDDAVLAVEEYVGLPWIKPVARVVRRIKGIGETIQSDILDTVKSVGDAVTVQLPYAGELIEEAFRLIGKTMDTFFQAPLQSISQLTRAVGKIQQALGLALQTKDDIKENLRFLGQRPFWMQLGEEFDLLWDDLKEAYDTLTSLLIHRQNAVIDSPFGVINRERQEEFVMQKVKQILNGVFMPLEALRNLSAPFLDAYNSVIDVINQVKDAYGTLKERYETVRSLVVKVFGPKFHKKFPRKRRPCSEDSCSCGGFPSTGGGRFDEGIDVLVGENAKVVAPVAGRAKSSGSGQVTITASAGSFSRKLIIMDDVVANASLSTSQEVYAGQMIGRAARSSCQPNSVHVTVKEPSSSDTLAPVDPTPYVDRIELPDLKWHQECDEYKLVLLGFTLASGKLSDAAKQTVSDIRRGRNPFKGVGDKVKDAVKSAKKSVDDAADQAKAGLKNLEKQVGRAVDDVSDAFTSSGVRDAFKNAFPAPKLDIPDYTGPEFGGQTGVGFGSFGDFFKKVKSNFLNYDPAMTTVGSTLDLFTKLGLLNDSNSLQELVNSLKSAIDDPHCQTPITASDKKLRSLLRRQGKQTTGTRYELIQRLNEIPDTACSGIRNALQRVSGQYCTVDADCLGFSCCTPLRVIFWRKFLKARARLDPCLGVLMISLGSWARTFNISHGFEDSVLVSGDVFGNDLSVTMSVQAVIDAASAIVSASVQLCSRLLRTCVLPLPIMHEATFGVSVSDCRSDSQSDDPTLSAILSMVLDDFQQEMTDAGIKGFVTTLVAKARAALLENLLNNVALAFSDPLGEFKKRVDFCQSASWNYLPTPKQFFEYDVSFAMGPVIVNFFFGARGAYGAHFELGICILSSQAKVAVTPWAGVELYGGVRVGIFIFFVEVSIHGHVLQVQFPARAAVGYAQMPLDVKGTVDVNLVPLKLSVHASVILYIKICFWACIRIRKTIWTSELWSYTSPTISKNVLTIGNEDKDESAPQFHSLTYNGNRKRRSDGNGVPCFVQQLLNRYPTTPGFQIEVSAYDDESGVSFDLDVGTYSGGRNVLAEFDMGGPQLLSTDPLPSGIPLYFTVKASNSQGRSSTATCSVPTYDITPPGGRMDQPYDISSHPFTLSALLVVHDDSELEDVGRASMGLGARKGNVIDWNDFSFNAVGINHDANDDLEHFAQPRLGRLTAPAVATTTVINPLKCASFCLSYGVQCVSFDYNYHSDQCIVMQAIEGPLVQRRVSGSFHNFERIGVGYTALFEHMNMTLNHGEIYYFNAEVKNRLGYTQLMTSKGTLIDFSPPFSGEVGDAKLDVTVTSQCTASFLQQCTDVSPWPNHRIIIDGEGGQAVFNGHEPFADLLYTRYNNFFGCNFHGFHDDESGIYKYAWSCGTEPLKTDVFEYEDPHAHLHDERHWTLSGTKLMDIVDGRYFVTVQVVNRVVFGGSLVTEVGHSTPYIVDTVPPEVLSVHGLEYDEVTHVLKLEYNTSDEMSGVREIDFALGRTVHDTELRSWDRHGNLTMLVVLIDVADGIPTWVRIRAIDNVYLMAVGHSHHPLVIDRSPPVVGYVFDGQRNGHDSQYTAVNDTICVNWDKFHDEQSGLAEFAEVGVGSSPGLTDVVPFQKVRYRKKETCIETTLLHGHSYYSTLVVNNQGHKQQSANESSDGVLVDLTDPVGGWTNDGLDPLEDVDYSYVDSAAYCNWNGFYDPESDVVGYEVQSFVSGVPFLPRSVGLATSSVDTTVSLRHGDSVLSVVTAIDGADRRTGIATNGYIIDKSPPLLISIGFEGFHAGIPFFQRDMSMIVATWAYDDPESGIMSYKVAIHELHHGSNQPIYPSQGDWADVPKQGEDGTVNRVVVPNLLLRNGAEYVVKVTATNRAELSVIHTSDPMTVDNTPPAVAWIVVGNLDGSDEEVDDLGRIVHSDQYGIEVSWFGSDPESDIETYVVAVGTTVGGSEASEGWRDVGPRTSAYVDRLSLSLTDDDSGQPVYYVTVKARNKASLVSHGVTSKAILIVQADVAGVVLDGPGVVDATFQRQSFAVTAQFTPFSSERCGGIAKHEWGIGTEPLEDDLQPFSSVGIVVRNDGSGFGQIPFQLQNGQTIYSTIKAATGCGNELISSSSGVTPDATAPQMELTQLATLAAGNISSTSSLYVYTVGSVGAAWAGRDEESGILNYRWSSSSIPAYFYTGDILSTINTQTNVGDVLRQEEGVPYFIWVEAENRVAYRRSVTSLGLVVDSSPPSVGTLRCPAAISDSVSEFDCCWDGVNDAESGLVQLNITMTPVAGGGAVADVFLQQVGASCFTISLVKEPLGNGSYLVTLQAFNGISLSSVTYATVVVDTSAPVVGKVHHLSDEYHLVVERNDTAGGTVQCQSSGTEMHVLWDPFIDFETPITRYEVAVGEYPGSMSLRSVESVGLTTSVRIDHLQLQHGSTVYVSIRGFNGAGLSSVSVSNGVVISTKPKLSVRDGLGEDIDFQASASLISASWIHSSACPVVSLSWAIYRVDGLVIQPLTHLPLDSSMAVTEEVSLRSGELYNVVVRLRNALGQVIIGRSDGVTVDIEPPVPGQVFDGPDAEVDLNYQASVTTLSVNWLGFGRTGSQAPGQKVVKYEVALGSDDRFTATRRNIVPFSDVGLNSSITLHDLDLIPRSQQYFFTVRAYGMTGATVEVTSNGIYVGFGQPLVPGIVHVKRFSNASSTLTASWDGFSSDLPILFFEWAISTRPVNISQCPESVSHYLRNEAIDRLFDVQSFVDVELDTVVTRSNLTLLHNQTYYVNVRATNEALGCVSAMSQPVVVDLTPPQPGIVTVGLETYLGASYVQASDEIRATWTGFRDRESGITEFEVALLRKDSCAEYRGALELEKVIDYISVGNATSYVFQALSLDSSKPYFVSVIATNGAGSATMALSKPVFVDLTAPLLGDLKDGDDWTNDKVFQSWLNVLQATATVAFTEAQMSCPDRDFDFGDGSGLDEWTVYNGDLVGNVPNYGTIVFESESDQVSIDRDGLKIGWVRDRGTVRLRSGAVYTKAGRLEDGSFLLEMKTGKGKAVLTSVVLWNGPKDTIGDFEASSVVRGSTSVANDQLNVSYSSGSGSGNGTEPYTVEPDLSKSIRNQSDQLDSERGESEYVMATASVGFQVLGESLLSEIGEGQRDFYLLFWCRFANDEQLSKSQWVGLGFDPSRGFHSYVIKTRQEQLQGTAEWAAELYVDDKLRAVLNGIPELSDNASFSIAVRTYKGYVPRLQDPFNPPSAFAHIRRVRLPAVASDPCHYGQPFRDFESPIVSIEACISSEPSGICDVVPFHQEESPCIPCRGLCDRYSCSAGCQFSGVSIRYFRLVNLSLSTGKVGLSSDGSVSSQVVFRPSVYYFVLRLKNAAGGVSVSVSDGVVIDTTAASCSAVYQVDPSWSLTEPAVYQGSNTSMAAFWQCSDNISGIVDYSWAIGTNVTSHDIQPYKSVSLATNSLRQGLALTQGMTYYVSIKIQNGAQLSSTFYGDGITVDVEPPDVSNVSLGAMFSEKWLNESDTRRTARGDRLGIAWNEIADGDVDKIEWSVGYADDGADVLPPVTVSIGGNSSYAEVIDGKVVIGQGDAVNLSDVAALQKKAFQKEKLDRSFLSVEPGRVMYHTLIVYSRAHKKSFVAGPKVAFLRSDDVTVSGLSASNQSNHSVLLPLAAESDSEQRVKILGLAVSDGGVVVVGALQPQDLATEYGSSAVIDYRSYIQNPEQTREDTSRRLASRFQTFLGTSFFVSPLNSGDVTGPLKFIVPFNTGISWGDEVPEVLFWDPTLREWRLASHSSCPRPTNVNWEKGILSVEVCLTWSKTLAGRKRRSTSSFDYLEQPTQFALASIKGQFVNTAPIIPLPNIHLSMDEDDHLSVRLVYSDEQDDKAVFRLDDQKSLLFGSVSLSDDGVLEVVPCGNCYGSAVIIYSVTEIDLPEGQPLSATGRVHVTVDPKQDPPLLYYATLPTYEARMATDGALMDVPVEQNTQDGTSISLPVALFDHDHGDILTLLVNPPSVGNVSVSKTLPATNATSIFEDALMNGTQIPPPTIKEYLIEYTAPGKYFGKVEIALVAHDQNSSYSNVLTVKVYVLAMPCQNQGRCSGNLSDPHCQSLERAYSYREYSCVCQPGYSGLLCQTEVDECAPEPCGVGYDCIDQVNGYVCVAKISSSGSSSSLHPGAIAGICIALVVAAVAVLGWLVWRKKMRRKTRMEITSDDSPTFENNGANGNVAYEEVPMTYFNKRVESKRYVTPPVGEGDTTLYDNSPCDMKGQSSHQGTEDIYDNPIEGGEVVDCTKLEDSPDQSTDEIYDNRRTKLDDSPDQSTEDIYDNRRTKLEDSPDQSTEDIYDNRLTKLEDSPDQSTEDIYDNRLTKLEDSPDQSTEDIYDNCRTKLEDSPDQSTDDIYDNRRERRATLEPRVDEDQFIINPIHVGVGDSKV